MKVLFHEEGDIDCSYSKEKTGSVLLHYLHLSSIVFDKA